MHHAVGAVAEADAPQLDAAGDEREGRAVGRVGELRLGVEHAEDLLQGRHRRLERVVELGELLDRVEEARQVAHECDHHADRQVLVEHPGRAEVEDDRRADAGQQLDAREVDPRQPHGQHVGLAVLVVDPAEDALRGLLAPEALDDADARQGLLQRRQHVGDALARAAVGPRRVDPEQRGADGQRREDHEREQRQLDVVREQDRHDAEEGEPVDDQRGHAVGDELLEGLDVAGQAAHRAARRGALVVAQLQAHQVAERVGAQVEEHPLADPARHVALVVAGQPADQPGQHEQPHRQDQRALVAGVDAVVDPELGQGGDGQARAGHHEHEEHGHHGAARVRPEVGQQAAQLALGEGVGALAQPRCRARGGAGGHASPARSSGRARPPSWISR